MSRRHKVVKDDTRLVLTVDLTDRATGYAINVSGQAIVRLYLRAENQPVVLDTVFADKLTGRTLDDGTLDSTVVDPGAGGRVQFRIPYTFTSRDPGLYEGEIEITFADGLIQSVYDTLKFAIRADF